MNRLVLILVFLLICAFSDITAGQPYCLTRTYDERDGLPHHIVNKILQDRNGMIWVATWNGLIRWDGYEFCTITPSPESGLRKYSLSFNDIKADANGKIWCFLDECVVLFDVDTYQFYDLQADIEKRLDTTVKVKRIAYSDEDDIVIVLTDGRCLYFDVGQMKDMDNPVEAMEEMVDESRISFKRTSERQLGDVHPFKKAELTFSRKDDSGNIWVITRDGRVLNAPSEHHPLSLMATFDVPDASLRYCCDDNQGNIWLRSRYGLHKVTLGNTSYSTVRSPRPSRLRALMIDNDGKIWLSWSDANYLCVMDSIEASMRYLTPDGHLSLTPVEFGSQVYGITQVSDSMIWLASKNNGLFRLTRRSDSNDSFSVDKYFNESGYSMKFYDIAVDGFGRLWISSMKKGIYVVENPAASAPEFKSLVELGGYPDKASRVRNISIIGDTLAVAATTGGLLCFNVPDSIDEGRIRYTVHTSDPDRPSSLGNIITMGVEVGNDGSLYVATASDGINRLVSPLSPDLSENWNFESCRKHYRRIPEVTLALTKLPDGRIMIVGNKEICLMDPEKKEEATVFGQGYWRDNIDFKEVKPLKLPDGRWIMGMKNGAIVDRLDENYDRSVGFPIEFTGISVEGEEMRTIGHDHTDITLLSDERALTVTFAALCFSDPKSIRYAYRMADDEDWKNIGTTRSLTFTHLDPGEYHIAVRSTDTLGRWLDNEKVLIVNVMPTFWETGLAKVLYVIVALGIIAAILATIRYMRKIRRQQRETLEAYLKLLESPKSNREEETDDSESVVSSVETRFSPDDRSVISSVVEFIENNFSNSSISVDDMAAAASISRSSLTRKMKSLMGVTPADFLKTTRLKRAAVLLQNSNLPIKNIAVDCGFADINYFGKCFKAVYGVTPGKYRSDRNT